MTAKARWNVVFAMLWLLVATSAAAIGLSTTRLVCARAVGEPSGCTFSRSGLFARTVAFPPGSISDAQVAERAGGKKTSPPGFAVLLLDQRGAEVELARFGNAELARSLRDELRAFLDDRTRTTYAHEVAPALGTYALVAGALAVSLGLLLHTRRSMRHGRAAPLDRAPSPFEVAAPGPLDPPATALGQGARVQLHGARPWVLGLAGLCLFAGVGSLLLVEYANRHQGAVEIRAESRCRFDGAELLPGAAMSLHLEPGRYSVDVYNSRVPGNWETQVVDIRLGETTHVRCSPLQR